ECVLEFLAGYFAGDGTVNLHGRLSWTTASERLTEQLQIVLLNLGLVSRRVKQLACATRDAEKRPYWTVTVSGEDADRLAARMPLLPTRKRLLHEQRRAEQPRVGRADVLPNASGYWQAISDELQRTVIARARVVGGVGYRGREGAHQILGDDYGNLHALRNRTH